ncbi:hypothetical protein HPB52_013652 [Rhipicephalus sanguineus]|uniref:Choline transporter-like protein n=1 Tax=Rhipicephalus sanguineus TaxID=34632 RepID=A0A9D4QEM8_RHISA|nr:hypothetical protein HPB52_013652 [Rhipicephalus sanguineus]
MESRNSNFLTPGYVDRVDKSDRKPSTIPLRSPVPPKSIPEAGDGEVTDFRKPDQVRECKDVFSLMVFSVFAVYMVCVAIAAASRRDYMGLLHHADSFGNLCGLDNRNRKLIGVPLSGQDMRGRNAGLLPYVCPAQAAEVRQLILRERDSKVVILIMIAIVLNKVTQVVGVLQEAGRALGDVPSVFGQAITTMCPPYVIFFLWLANIVLSCQHFVVASTVATWYFTKHKTHISAPVVRSMQLLVGYHLGSVIYGSLVLVVAEPLRAIISGSRLV